jgi:hypothetical protein
VLLLQVHLTEQGPEARIVADRIKKRVALDRHHVLIASLSRPVEPFEGTPYFSEPEMNPGIARGRHVSLCRHSVKALEQGAGLGCVAAQSQCEPKPADH